MNAPLRIVVADGDAAIRRCFVRILKDLGHTVVGTAATGEQLWRLCKNSPPDLMITEALLPDRCDFSVIAEIARQWSTPAIVVSSEEQIDLPDAVTSPNVLAYLMKPVSASDLREVLARHFGPATLSTRPDLPASASVALSEQHPVSRDR